jgi:hypothetical protein
VKYHQENISLKHHSANKIYHENTFYILLWSDSFFKLFFFAD